MEPSYFGGSAGGGGVCRRRMVCSVERLLREYLRASLIEVSLQHQGLLSHTQQWTSPIASRQAQYSLHARAGQAQSGHHRLGLRFYSVPAGHSSPQQLCAGGSPQAGRITEPACMEGTLGALLAGGALGWQQSTHVLVLIYSL